MLVLDSRLPGQDVCGEVERDVWSEVHSLSICRVRSWKGRVEKAVARKGGESTGTVFCQHP